MEYDANQIIIREDEFNNNLYILLEGSAGHVINKSHVGGKPYAYFRLNIRIDMVTYSVMN